LIQCAWNEPCKRIQGSVTPFLDTGHKFVTVASHKVA
jgi:hypothetical protein